MRDSMVFYRNFRDALAKLPPEIRLEAYEAIFAYALDEQEPGDGVAGAIVQCFVPTIQKNNQRYENGKHGGRPKNQTETKPEPNETEHEPKCKVLSDKCEVEECKSVKCESVSPNGDKREKATTSPKRETASRFRPPTVEEVEQYCFERNNRVDPERFVDFYSSNGWKVGKNPMKDWKAAVRTWEKRDGPDNVVEMTNGQKARQAQNDVLKAMYQGIL